MVNAKVDARKDLAEVRFGGDPFIVAAELSALIGSIYRGITVKEPEKAGIFRETMLRMMEPGSPTWTHEFDMTMITMPVNREKE